MSDENKDLEQNQNNVSADLVGNAVSNDVTNNVTSNVDNTNIESNVRNNNETGIVEEVSFNYPENGVEKMSSEPSQGSVENSVPTVSSGTIEEVSVSADTSAFNTLEATEVASDSVFNKQDEVIGASNMKEGQEHLAEKKSFPYGMVIVFVILIICALFIDNIVYLVDDVILGKNKTEEQEETKKNEENQDETDNKKEDEKENSNGNAVVKDENNLVGRTLTLTELKESFDNSVDVINYETQNNISINTYINENRLVITTVSALGSADADISTLTVEYIFNNNILSAECNSNNSEFGKKVSIFLIKEIAQLQGVASTNLDNYINNNLNNLTIDKGFEIKKLENGNTSYKIATNIKMDVK